MRKLFIGIVLFGFIAVVVCMAYSFLQFQKNFDKPRSAQELSDIAYYKLHGKEIGQKFKIDSVNYTIGNFDYIINSHNSILIVNVKIENNTHDTKLFSNKFFALKDFNKLDYYPEIKSLELKPDQIQDIKFTYQLPEKMLPYIRYELHLLGKDNASENAIIILYKNYRSGG